MKFYCNFIDLIKMLPYYCVRCDFSFIEIYVDDGCKTETVPERNPLQVFILFEFIFHLVRFTL